MMTCPSDAAGLAFARPSTAPGSGRERGRRRGMVPVLGSALRDRPEVVMTAAQDGRYLPIIYLRGFTFGRGGTETTVDDPFYGFNSGSTHVRQDETGQPVFYVFESPVLRLLSDHGYRDSYITGVQAGLDAKGLRTLEKQQDKVDAGRTAGQLRPGPAGVLPGPGAVRRGTRRRDRPPVAVDLPLLRPGLAHLSRHPRATSGD